MIRFSTLDVELPPIEPQRVKAWIEGVVSFLANMFSNLMFLFIVSQKMVEFV